eukprot:Skav209958  [mRNA]  locus=scaffold2335:103979:105944:- [translate_table: standard]
MVRRAIADRAVPFARRMVMFFPEGGRHDLELAPRATPAAPQGAGARGGEGPGSARRVPSMKHLGHQQRSTATKHSNEAQQRSTATKHSNEAQQRSTATKHSNEAQQRSTATKHSNEAQQRSQEAGKVAAPTIPDGGYQQQLIEEAPEAVVVPSSTEQRLYEYLDSLVAGAGGISCSWARLERCFGGWLLRPYPTPVRDVRFHGFTDGLGGALQSQDHTADVILHSWGKTLEEAFEQCCAARQRKIVAHPAT